MTTIQALPTEVIDLIAAGEVIDSLAAVVRELAENALDAGATRISISLWTEAWRIRITDNGNGMSLADLQQAALSHATSKIQRSADLGQISSLGFRGEALHSVAQLADLEICSRDVEADAGYRVSYNHQGKPVQVQPVALAPGTIVTASHLFENWQARRQSLPTLTQQLRAAQQIVQQLALCHPQVTWQVEQNDRPWFAIWGCASPKFLLAQLLRDVQPSDLYEFKLHDQHDQKDNFSATLASLPAMPSSSLLMGLPDRCHRHRPDWLKVAVNRRIVQFPELEQAMLSAFRRTMPRDRYPVCLLYLHVAPDQVDWNRHPAKAEIYLRNLDYWQTQVKQSIQQALQSSLALLPDPFYNAQIGQMVKVAESEGVYRSSRSVSREAGQSDQATPSADQTDDQTDADPENSETELSTELECETESNLLPLKAVAQLHNMYILAEHPSGMWLIEQHIVHERILYEQLQDRWQVVELESPLVLGQLSAAQIEQLQRLSIAVEPFGEQRWAVRSAPESLVNRQDCAAAILELSQGGDLETALVATACRTAIRNGYPLTLPEMQTLLDQWQQTRNPRTCPHGRPIYLSLEESSLSRFFRRHWVIGKSHGI